MSRGAAVQLISELFDSALTVSDGGCYSVRIDSDMESRTMEISCEEAGILEKISITDADELARAARLVDELKENG